MCGKMPTIRPTLLPLQEVRQLSLLNLRHYVFDVIVAQSWNKSKRIGISLVSYFCCFAGNLKSDDFCETGIKT